MKILHQIVALSAALSVSACNPAKSTAEAEKAAADFHALFNAENYEKIYDSAHADFKGSQAKPEVIDFIRSVREKLGPSKSVTKTGWQVNSHNLKTNIVLTYRTDFEKGSGIETFTYRVADGSAALLGWHINSKNLLLTTAQTEQGDAADPAKPEG